MNVLVEHYNACKYDCQSKTFKREEFKNVVRYEVVADQETVETIEASCGLRDEYHEYLILHFEDGSASTFCNSRVDLFRI